MSCPGIGIPHHSSFEFWVVIVVNEVLVPLVNHVDKPLECLEAAVFIPKLLDDLSVGIAIGLGDDWWEG